MNLSKLAFIDVETTGMSPKRDRVIDIGVVLVEHGQVIQTWESLINPDQYVSPFISSMTGISPFDLEKAPVFGDIASELLELLEDRVFVAHNAQFDYGFVKEEFDRIGEHIHWPRLCTLHLSRKFFPQYQHHNLDAIVDRFQIVVDCRHRALPDAQATWEFFRCLQAQHLESNLLKSIHTMVLQPSLPPHISPEMMDGVAQQPGVYIFYGDQPQPLYIGKSVNMHDRVLSHFQGVAAHPNQVAIRQQLRQIETIPTAGDLSAQLLESQMIKQSFPLYNRQLRYYHSLALLKAVPDRYGYHQLKTIPSETTTIQDIPSIAGVFRSKRVAKTSLQHLAEVKGLCYKYLGLENTKKACFGYHLGQCRGACVGKEKPEVFNLRLAEALVTYQIKSWPYQDAIVIYELLPSKAGSFEMHLKVDQRLEISNWSSCWTTSWL